MNVEIKVGNKVIALTKEGIRRKFVVKNVLFDEFKGFIAVTKDGVEYPFTSIIKKIAL